jgi:N-acyl-D-amino-acid deacylase
MATRPNANDSTTPSPRRVPENRGVRGRRGRCWLAAALLAGLASTGLSATTLIRGATLIDGTGAPARQASLRIDGDLIQAIGKLSIEPGESVIDATGLVLAPGFIDTHSHHDVGIDAQPDTLPVVSQGVTTIVRGQDGFSDGDRKRYTPLAEFNRRLQARPVAVNIASFAPHNSIRYAVLGDNTRREATTDEIEIMAELVAQDMAAGALGLSTGLEYDPGIYASTAEVVTLAKIAAEAGGRYSSHLRSEDRTFWQAVDEIISIGRLAELPVHISHIKLGAKYLWGQTDRLLEHLDAARADGIDITADIYPYEYWQATITVLFPERDYTSRETAAYILDYLVPAEDLILTRYDADPSLTGKSIADIANQRGDDDISTLIDITVVGDEANRRAGGPPEQVIARGMQRQDIVRLMAWPHTSICSDGSLDSRHPRGSGSFPRVLKRYAGGDGQLTLVEAIHKMTGLAARNSGILDRGTLRPGAFADLVLFDPVVIEDRATYEQPDLQSVGIEQVWVNGIAVFRAGKPTGARPGRPVYPD